MYHKYILSLWIIGENFEIISTQKKKKNCGLTIFPDCQKPKTWVISHLTPVFFINFLGKL